MGRILTVLLFVSVLLIPSYGIQAFPRGDVHVGGHWGESHPGGVGVENHDMEGHEMEERHMGEGAVEGDEMMRDEGEFVLPEEGVVIPEEEEMMEPEMPQPEGLEEAPLHE